jgi:hypothetical protein
MSPPLTVYSDCLRRGEQLAIRFGDGTTRPAGLARGIAPADAVDELPGTGTWQSAPLLDGNVGIGGDPTRLLCRIRGLLAPDGQILVELAAPHTPTGSTRIRLETPRQSSDWFDWAEVSALDGALVAADAGLEVQNYWNEGERWFALLSAR